VLSKKAKNVVIKKGKYGNEKKRSKTLKLLEGR
jgi:hypothetical protein